MSISSDVATLLRGQTSVRTSITGKDVGVYPVGVPQGKTPPLVLVTTLSTEFHKTLDNPGGVATDLHKATLDVDCKGATPVIVAKLKKAVSAFLGDYSGAAGDSTIKSVEVEDCGDDVETPEDAGAPIYVETLAVEVMYL